MRINKTANCNTENFKGFYNISAELEQNIPLSRGVIDIFGSDIPWLIMANNNAERMEKARRMSIVFVLLFLSPMALLPVFNRIAMKYGSKLVKSVLSDNHKIIHISNKELTDAASMKKGLEKLSSNYENGPIENLFRKITGKKKQKPLEYQPMLEDIKTRYNLKTDEQALEKLRRKLINTKNGVMCADYLFSSLSLGSVGFINNAITKKKTGQSGFSAEFSMADKETVAKRADNYEKTWKQRYAALLGISFALGIGVPLAVRHGLTGNTGKFAGFMKRQVSKFDYEKGIYMSRWSLLLGNIIACHTGAVLANRNVTETKDNILRFGMADALFFGGDLVVGSVLGRLSDRFLKTNLIDKTDGKKLLPRLKPMKTLTNPRERKTACGLYWLNLAIISASMGFGVPALANRITRKDVQKELKSKNIQEFDFLKQFVSSSKLAETIRR
ncbi:MAG: hypothetical protein LBK53_07270 [Heliobacteriaceae bacterium]|jgi:hypothetical protein|nr:hypothetical protein [Heliobacteriaceae bacterium]